MSKAILLWLEKRLAMATCNGDWRVWRAGKCAEDAILLNISSVDMVGHRQLVRFE